MSSKVTWVRPLGAWSICMTVIVLHAAGLSVPLWADVVAPAAIATWFIDRSLWKYVVGRKNGTQL